MSAQIPTTASRQVQEKRIAAFVAAGFDQDSAATMVADASAHMQRKELIHESVMVDLLSEWHLMEREIEEVGKLIAAVSGF